MNPNLDEFPTLLTSTRLTCGVSGIPLPNITWLKDGEVLEGERSSVLFIPEVDIENRGLYQCVAVNFNPNDVTETVKKTSEEAVINIKGQ